MNKRRVLFALIPSIIVLALLFYLWSVNLVFILASELSIETNLDNYSYHVSNGQTADFSPVTYVEAPNTCSTKCEFLLREIATNKTLFYDSQLVKSRYKTDISYLVNQSTNGTLHLSYEAKCHNLISAICSSTQDPYYETSFITIHYSQTPQQEFQEEQVKEQLQHLQLTLDTSLSFLNESQYLLFQLGIENVSESRTVFEKNRYLRTQASLLQTRIDYFIHEWSIGKFASLSQNDIATLDEELFAFEKEAFVQKNTSLFLQSQLEEAISGMNEIISYQDELLYLQEFQEAKVSDFSKDVLSQLNTSLVIYDSKNMETLTDFSTTMISLRTDARTLLSIYQNIVLDAINETIQVTQIWNNNSISTLPQACQTLTQTSQSIKLFNQQANLTFATVYPDEYANETFVDMIENNSVQFYLNQSYNYSYKDITPYYEEFLDDIQEVKDTYCLFVPSFTEHQPVSEIEIEPFDTSIQLIELQRTSGDCCVYGVCLSCSEYDDYPILLVHGHALTSVTSPEAALHSFSKIQKRLENEGYVNVGELNDYPIKSWKEVDGPISVRASYYFVTYAELGQYQFYSKKYESIESYAIRLKEIVEEIKYKTGKDKVVIVAHSMGGLVTRQYLALFGEDSVDKAVLIGTPNNGVIGASQRLCSLTGANKECEEMAQDSVFLKRLNQYIPTKTSMYVIAGRGCSMNGLEADGVVTLDSVLLPYANNTIVNGTCTDALNSEMHKALIDPDKYPEVYERLVEILNE